MQAWQTVIALPSWLGLMYMRCHLRVGAMGYLQS